MIVRAAGDLWKINEVALAWPSKLTSFAAESKPKLQKFKDVSRCGLPAMWITFDLI